MAPGTGTGEERASARQDPSPAAPLHDSRTPAPAAPDGDRDGPRHECDSALRQEGTGTGAEVPAVAQSLAGRDEKGVGLAP